MTNGQLYQWHIEIQKLQQSVIMYLLKGRLADFYKDYGVKINAIVERIDKLQREHFAFEGNDIKKNGEEFVMLEGKTYDQYIEKYRELMAEQTTNPLKLYNA